MTTYSREQVYQALFALVTPLRAPGATPAAPGTDPTPGVPTSQRPFNLVSRETIEVQRIAPALQPVLFMDEAIEDYVVTGNGLVHHKWTLYFHVGCTSPKGVAAATVLNPLLDLLQDTLMPGGDPSQDLGLGDGLIVSAQFSGLSVKNLGDNSTNPSFRQAVCYVPFEIVLPA